MGYLRPDLPLSDRSYATLRYLGIPVEVIEEFDEEEAQQRIDEMLARWDREERGRPKPPMRTGKAARCFRCYRRTTKIDAGEMYWCEGCRYRFDVRVWAKQADDGSRPCWELIREDGRQSFSGLCTSRESAWMLARECGWQLQDEEGLRWLRKNRTRVLRGQT